MEGTTTEGIYILISNIIRFPSSLKKRFVTVVLFDGITIKRNEFSLIAFYEVEAERMKRKIYSARCNAVKEKIERREFSEALSYMMENHICKKSIKHTMGGSFSKNSLDTSFFASLSNMKYYSVNDSSLCLQ